MFKTVVNHIGNLVGINFNNVVQFSINCGIGKVSDTDQHVLNVCIYLYTNYLEEPKKIDIWSKDLAEDESKVMVSLFEYNNNTLSRYDAFANLCNTIHLEFAECLDSDLKTIDLREFISALAPKELEKIEKKVFNI